MFEAQSYFCSFLALKYFPLFMVVIAILSFFYFLWISGKADSFSDGLYFCFVFGLALSIPVGMLVIIYTATDIIRYDSFIGSTLIFFFNTSSCIFENGHYGKVDISAMSIFVIIFSVMLFFGIASVFLFFLHYFFLIIRSIVLYVSLVKEQSKLIYLRFQEKNKLKNIKLKLKLALEVEQKTIEKALPQISARELRLAKSRQQFMSQNFDQEG